MTMETKVNMIIVILGFWPVAIAQLAQTTATVDLVNALAACASISHSHVCFVHILSLLEQLNVVNTQWKRFWSESG